MALILLTARAGLVRSPPQRRPRWKLSDEYSKIGCRRMFEPFPNGEHPAQLA
jgi:hypothetical protein